MGTVSIQKIAKQALHFKTWCDESRWTTTKLAKEFEKYGKTISPSTIWYWQRGEYSPRNEKTFKILSEICGFNAHTFSNFQK